jgi:hypothetical protein
LIYRGSEHRFLSKDFHSRCDSHGSTLTLIKATSGCIFGGFAALPGDSSNQWLTDQSNKSFLFSINSQAGVRKYNLQVATNCIYCHTSYGPYMGNEDLIVANQCNQNTSSYSILGNSYQNNTPFNGNAVLSNSQNFQVAEIEVYQVFE